MIQGMTVSGCVEKKKNTKKLKNRKQKKWIGAKRETHRGIFVFALPRKFDKRNLQDVNQRAGNCIFISPVYLLLFPPPFLSTLLSFFVPLSLPHILSYFSFSSLAFFQTFNSTIHCLAVYSHVTENRKYKATLLTDYKNVLHLIHHPRIPCTYSSLEKSSKKVLRIEKCSLKILSTVKAFSLNFLSIDWFKNSVVFQWCFFFLFFFFNCNDVVSWLTSNVCSANLPWELIPGNI